MLAKAESIIINDIISKIYTMEPFDEMRLEVLKEMEDIIPYNKASFYMASENDEHILGNPVGVGIALRELERYITDFEDKDYTRWIFLSSNNIVYRESDMFPDSARENQEYFREIYLKEDMYFSLQAGISVNGIFRGVISLYRGQGQTDFSDKEMFIVELLLLHFENRIKSEMEESSVEKIKSKVHITTYEYMDKYGLTRREVEILGFLMSGSGVDSISEKLGISSNTLKKHCTSIYRKLNINSRWELMKFMDEDSVRL